MAKVKCKVCQNEVSRVCSVKGIGVKPNKPRICEAFVLDESKIKAKESIPTTRLGYTKYQELKAKAKKERKELLEALKAGPGNKTAEALGLLEKEETSIITPGNSRFILPQGNLKHPLTGDLSRFKSSTNANIKPENTHASKLKMS